MSELQRLVNTDNVTTDVGALVDHDQSDSINELNFQQFLLQYLYRSPTRPGNNPGPLERIHPPGQTTEHH